MGGWTNPLTRLSTGSTAPLSSLLPEAPPDYAKTIQPGVSSSSKQQYLADILGKTGTETLESGTALLGTPLDYWQNVLKTPTRQGLLEETGPVASSIVSQYSTGKKALGQLPRGGGTSAALANLPFQEAGDITALLERQLGKKINELQPEAARAITQIGQTLSGMGLEELGLSSQDLTQLIAAQITKRGQTMELYGDLGKAVGGIISTLLLPSPKKGG